MKRLLRTWLATILTGLLLSPSLAMAKDDKVTLNFTEADIDSVIKAIGQISGKNFLIDPRVKGKINIVSASPVPASTAHQVLLSALRMHGFTTVDTDGVIKVMPEAEGKFQGGELVRKNRGQGDRILTQVFPLKYESSKLLLPVVRPLVGPHGSVVETTAFNALVVTDYTSGLRRLEKILAEIDQPTAATPFVIPLRHAAVADVQQTLNRVFSDAINSSDRMQKVTITPDLRTNSLIVRSENVAFFERIRTLVENMDKETSASGNIHIVYLKNGDATLVAKTLRGILTGETSTASSTTAATTASPASTSAAVSSSAQGAGIIQADAASNSLIITAPDAIYRNLRTIIEKLDFRRAQVHVEALIVEVTADKAAEFGIQWQQLSGASGNSTHTIGGTNFGNRGGGANIIDAATNLGSLGNGLNVGVVRGQITLPGIGSVLNLGMLARALESDANANILSTPNLLTLDNEEAKIVIGQNVPFITGQYAQTGSATTATPFQTIERKDVGLTLKIRPQISEGGSVRLQIFQEVSSVQDKTNAAGIITNKRSIDSTVLVDDAQIVVLGGLMQDSVSEGIDKVPLLGDIPLLGSLFKTETRKRSKTNLMVFLRPTILRDAKAYVDLTDQRYRYIMGEQSGNTPRPHAILPDMEAPKLLLSPNLPQNGTPAK